MEKIEILTQIIEISETIDLTSYSNLERITAQLSTKLLKEVSRDQCRKLQLKIVYDVIEKSEVEKKKKFQKVKREEIVVLTVKVVVVNNEEKVMVVESDIPYKATELSLYISDFKNNINSSFAEGYAIDAIRRAMYESRKHSDDSCEKIDVQLTQFFSEFASTLRRSKTDLLPSYHDDKVSITKSFNSGSNEIAIFEDGAKILRMLFNLRLFDFEDTQCNDKNERLYFFQLSPMTTRITVEFLRKIVPNIKASLITFSEGQILITLRESREKQKLVCDALSFVKCD